MNAAYGRHLIRKEVGGYRVDGGKKLYNSLEAATKAINSL